MSLAGTIVLVLQDPTASFPVGKAEGEVVYAGDATEALKGLSLFQIDAAVLKTDRCSEKLIDELQLQSIPFLALGPYSPIVGRADWQLLGSRRGWQLDE
jgi:hypothetical protein